MWLKCKKCEFNYIKNSSSLVIFLTTGSRDAFSAFAKKYGRLSSWANIKKIFSDSIGWQIL